MTRAAFPVAGQLEADELYGDLYTEEGISDELQSLGVAEVRSSLLTQPL